MWLRHMRERKNLTQEEVSNRVGIARAAYGNIENGRRRPSVEVAKRIAAVLGFDWTRFFEDAPEEEKEPPQIGAAGKVG